jgi:hypothetical protein
MRICTVEGKLFEAVDDQKLNAGSGKNCYWRLKRLLVLKWFFGILIRA